MKFGRFSSVIAATVFLLVSASAVAGGFKPPIKQFWGFQQGEAQFVENFACFNPDPANFRFPVETVTETAGWIRGMGWMAMDTRHCSPGNDGLVTDGQATFTSWKGDELVASYTAETVMPPPWIVQEVKFTILGGTGRFEDAFGTLFATLIVEGQFDDDGEPMAGPWRLRFAFSGWAFY